MAIAILIWIGKALVTKDIGNTYKEHTGDTIDNNYMPYGLETYHVRPYMYFNGCSLSLSTFCTYKLNVYVTV